MCHLDVAEKVLATVEINWVRQPREVQKTKWNTATGQVLEATNFDLEMPIDFTVGSRKLIGSPVAPIPQDCDPAHRQ